MLGPGAAPAVAMPQPGAMPLLGRQLEASVAAATGPPPGAAGAAAAEDQQAALLDLIRRMNSEQLGAGGKASLAAVVKSASPTKRSAAQDGDSFPIPRPRAPASLDAAPSPGMGLQALFSGEPSMVLSPNAAALDSLLIDGGMPGGLSTDFGGVQNMEAQQGMATRRSVRR